MTLFTHKVPITDLTVIKQLLPQREPMLMVDSLRSFSEDSLTSNFTITEDTIFVKDNNFQEAGLLENMAQSVALHTGYKGLTEGLKPRVGYVAAIKKATFARLPIVGDTLKTEVLITYKALEMTMVEVAIFLKDEKIAWATMTTILKPEHNEA